MALANPIQRLAKGYCHIWYLSSDACASSFLLPIPVRWLGEVEFQGISILRKMLAYSTYFTCSYVSRFLCRRQWKRDWNFIVSKFWNACLLLTDCRHSMQQIKFQPRKLFVWLSVIEGTSIWGNWTQSDAWRRNVFTSFHKQCKSICLFISF